MTNKGLFEYVSATTGAFIKKSKRKVRSNRKMEPSLLIPIPKLYDSLVKIAETRDAPIMNVSSKSKVIDDTADEDETIGNSTYQKDTSKVSNDDNPTDDDVDSNIDEELRKRKWDNNEEYSDNSTQDSSKAVEESGNSNVANVKKNEKRIRLPDPSDNRNPGARKKKKCSVCNLSFANMTTHKRTHLSPEDKPFHCDICPKSFSRNFDFLRHKKEHVQKALIQDVNSQDAYSDLTNKSKLTQLHNIGNVFRCPYNEKVIDLDLSLHKYKVKPASSQVANCHHNGMFFRKDTLRNHLRSHHFDYDKKELSVKEKACASGRCRFCNEWHENAKIWADEHVGKKCGYSFH
ncbi:hypothetical protein TPHA_0B02390 [Tetrapisispora phaffii CBS 4417]|uniref:C2H2-type domain-containing protein n=1 Tax=Tetrapisispora phaffii (strain ATCC 24235 / CBS 4417 / NBRC 1672 / NRRL Y-8282 / UCD 70-5) TaxID=1071381 RepID=G8BPI1_TETPH|nr:hypothetical protein TPHA_0B02390 [Tetrapisispora phaffii CBS 4417]CCE61912.1 hypothetical protein TPHA_0B02390 [Tetrapisispora phaffii CBS 4417]